MPSAAATSLSITGIRQRRGRWPGHATGGSPLAAWIRQSRSGSLNRKQGEDFLLSHVWSSFWCVLALVSLRSAVEVLVKSLALHNEAAPTERGSTQNSLQQSQQCCP